jgi:hypothetical protein
MNIQEEYEAVNAMLKHMGIDPKHSPVRTAKITGGAAAPWIFWLAQSRVH